MSNHKLGLAMSYNFSAIDEASAWLWSPEESGMETISKRWDRILPSMKQVFVSQSLIEVEMRKEWLEQAGIRCTIKNQRISGLAGEIPFTETFPELWVIQNEDYDQARRILEEGLVLLPSNQDTWTCAGCGERHESQFGTCWKCGRDKPST